jgi:hypothetical protein
VPDKLFRRLQLKRESEPFPGKTRFQILLFFNDVPGLLFGV